MAATDVWTQKTDTQASGNHVAAAKCLSCARVDIVMAGTTYHDGGNHVAAEGIRTNKTDTQASGERCMYRIRTYVRT